MKGFQSEFVLEQDNGSKFRSIIFDVEAILLALDDCMASANTNVIDSYLTLMASA